MYVNGYIALSDTDEVSIAQHVLHLSHESDPGRTFAIHLGVVGQHEETVRICDDLIASIQEVRDDMLRLIQRKQAAHSADGLVADASGAP